MKISAIQLNMVQCTSEADFFYLLDEKVKKAKSMGAEIISFPEDLGFCLAWSKESFRVQNIRKNISPEIQPLFFKNFFEILVDWIFSRIKLNAMGEWLSQKRISDIIKRVFQKLAIENNVVIVSGSTYERRFNGIFNIAYVYDCDGRLSGYYKKYKLVPIEKAWGVKSGNLSDPILTSKGNLGLVICYDLDDPDFIKKMVDKGAQILFAPSGGWRPYPNYPFDKEKEQPQIQRAKENKIPIVRPYCCGWLFPGLYFQGHTQIVDQNGKIIVESADWGKEEIFVVDIELKQH